MATLRDETLWQPLADPEAAEAPCDHGRCACKTKAVGLSAFVGIAVALLIFCSSAPGTWAPHQPSQLASVFRVDDFNNILRSIPIIDAADMFKTLPEPQLKALFVDFLSKAGSTAPKTDGTFQRKAGPRNSFDTAEEHAYRFKVFSENLLAILHQNAQTQRSNPELFRAVFGITEFTDWTPEEFKLMQSMSATNITNVDAQLAKDKAATRGMSPKGASRRSNKGEAQALPMCLLYYPVRNQKSCGDCWAFSTAEVIRMRLWKEYRQNPGVLSVQQLVDCDPEEIGKRCREGVNGCCGGMPSRAINWLHESGGIATVEAYGPLVSDDYPFYAEECHHVPKAVLPGKALFPSTEQIMANWLCQFGALSIAVDGTPLQSYTSGVLSSSACSKPISHAVLVVGIDTKSWQYADGTLAPVWIVQNSWGNSWGVEPSAPFNYVYGKSGFYLLQWGYDVCHVKDYATIPYDAEPL